MRKLLLLLVLITFGFSQNAWSQKGHSIDFKIKNYEEETVLIAYYYGDKQLVHDTIQRSQPGHFSIKGNEALEPGVYLLILFPDKEWIQFIVNSESQHFEVTLDAKNLSDIKFKGSKDNEVFENYVNFLAAKRKEADDLEKGLLTADSLGVQFSKTSAKLDKIDQEVKAEQNRIVQKYPNFITSLLIKANQDVEIPEFKGTDEEIQMERYLYYKKHYWDNLEMGNPASLRTPFLYQKIRAYLDKLTVQQPDSVNRAIDLILEKLSPSQESFRYYLSHLVNHYARSKMVGFDAVYVHLVENYYAKGRAPWMDEENLAKMVNEARLTKPLLIGKTAPDFQTFTEDGSEYKLSESSAEYTVLVFWAPDCGHCKKAMPFVIDFAEKYKDKGVEVVTICNQTGDKVKTCWESVKEKGMQNLINTADEKDRSRIRYKYYVKSTPMIYVLDKNREILIKKIGAEQLESIMDEIIDYHKNAAVK